MKTEKRRKEIANYLLQSGEAVSGAALSEKFGVSRQIIVGDINNLKASGYDIISTHYGYVIRDTPLIKRIFKVWHTREQTEDELSLIVGCGGTVADVFVWHKVYGKISVPLNIFSEMQIRHFMEGVRSGKSSELMDITGGFHYHTVTAENEKILEEIEARLSDRGYIAPEKSSDG